MKIRNLVTALLLAGTFTSQIQARGHRPNPRPIPTPVNGSEKVEALLEVTQKAQRLLNNMLSSVDASDLTRSINEDDDLALPLYEQATDYLFDSSENFIEGDQAWQDGEMNLFNYKMARGCSKLAFARLRMARANWMAYEVGSSMILQSFGPEVMEMLEEIDDNRNMWCR